MMEVASEAGVCFVPDCFEARKYEDGLSKHVDHSREQVEDFYGIVARRVPEARKCHDDYFTNALLVLGHVKHFEGEYRAALELYVDALRYEVTVDAVGGIGLTILAVLAESSRRALGRLTAGGRRPGNDDGVDQ